jgi:hypothetical protein
MTTSTTLMVMMMMTMAGRFWCGRRFSQTFRLDICDESTKYIKDNSYFNLFELKSGLFVVESK